MTMNGGAMLSQHLQQRLEGLVSRRFPKLRFFEGEVVPTFDDLAPGAAEIVREYLGRVGDAQFLADGSTDLPVVNLEFEERVFRAAMLGAAFTHTFQQLRAYEFSGRLQQVSDVKQATTYRVIAERMDKFCAFGSGMAGATGALNSPLVTAENLSDNLYTMTGDQLRSFFLDKAAQVSKATSGTFDRLNLLVSHDIYSQMERTRIADGSVYVLESLTGPNSRIASVQWLDYLSFDQMVGGQANKDRIVFYPEEPPLPAGLDATMIPDYSEIWEFHIEPIQMAPMDYWTINGFTHRIPMFAVVSPVIITQPDGLRYVDVPKKA